jgi:hypothetical protein
VDLSEVLVPQFAMLKMLRGVRKGDPRAAPFIQQIKDVLKKSAQGAAFEGVQETLAGLASRMQQHKEFTIQQ